MMEPILSGGMYAAYIFAGIAALLLLVAIVCVAAFFRNRAGWRKKYDAAVKRHDAYEEWSAKQFEERQKDHPYSDYDLREGLRSEWSDVAEGNSYRDTNRPSRSEFETSKSDYLWPAFGFAVVALFIGGITATAVYPFNWEYHQWASKQGVVQESVGRQVDASDSGLYSTYSIKVDGVIYDCDEARCSLVAKGDTIKFRTMSHYQRAGAPTHEMRVVSLKKN